MEQRAVEQQKRKQEQPPGSAKQDLRPLSVDAEVRIKGTSTVGRIESIDGSMTSVIFGGIRTRIKLNRLERATQNSNTQTTETPKSKADERMESLRSYNLSHLTQQTIDSHRKNFHQDLDVRGMRGDEALNAVQHFVDDAILMGMQRVRILHGKGNGILRQLIRRYLGAIPNVTHYADEHVQFGGAGITVVDL